MISKLIQILVAELRWNGLISWCLEIGILIVCVCVCVCCMCAGWDVYNVDHNNNKNSHHVTKQLDYKTMAVNIATCSSQVWHQPQRAPTVRWRILYEHTTKPHWQNVLTWQRTVWWSRYCMRLAFANTRYMFLLSFLRPVSRLLFLCKVGN